MKKPRDFGKAMVENVKGMFDEVKKGCEDSYAQGYYHGVMDSSAGVHNEKLRKKGEEVDKR